MREHLPHLLEAQLVGELVEVRHAEGRLALPGEEHSHETDAAVLRLNPAARLVARVGHDPVVALLNDGILAEQGVPVVELPEVAVRRGAAEADVGHAEALGELLEVGQPVLLLHVVTLEAVPLAALDAVEVGSGGLGGAGRAEGVEHLLEGDDVRVDLAEDRDEALEVVGVVRVPPAVDVVGAEAELGLLDAPHGDVLGGGLGRALGAAPGVLVLPGVEGIDRRGGGSLLGVEVVVAQRGNDHSCLWRRERE
mmetsp:Transcript_13609/g.33381  ORF Transcript_13609/g.33381 Transcript_13609/m.33381 type:complete len:252 (+) Transcript_13609:526-1281(+)